MVYIHLQQLQETLVLARGCVAGKGELFIEGVANIQVISLVLRHVMLRAPRGGG